MIVISGPSASGKTEVAKLLQKKYGITKVITTTTREMRKGEKNGVDYFFISYDEFKTKIENEDFVEYMEYNGNLYGSTKDQIGDNKVIVTDLKGLEAYTNLHNSQIVTFYLHCDEKTRYKRMLSRGDGFKSAHERIKTDKAAFDEEHIPEVDFNIDNINKPLVEVTKEVYNKYYKKLAKK